MSVPRIWRETPQRYRLEAGKCTKCGKVHYPPRLICDVCRSQDFEKVTVSDEATIVTFTVIHTPPSQFKDQAPYAIAVVETKDGLRSTFQVADSDGSDLEIGTKVRLQFRMIQQEGEAGVIAYGHKASIV